MALFYPLLNLQQGSPKFNSCVKFCCLLCFIGILEKLNLVDIGKEFILFFVLVEEGRLKGRRNFESHECQF